MLKLDSVNRAFLASNEIRKELVLVSCEQIRIPVNVNSVDDDLFRR